MSKVRCVVSALLTLLIATAIPMGASSQATPSPSDPAPAPLFAELGDFHHEIETDVPLAQTYFDQGMILAFGFNHAEAARSFREAQRLDPDCAMCYWGEALVLGPNINAAMPDENVPAAWAALEKAREHADKATPRHRAYIEALTARYRPEPLEDRSKLDLAYAEAMGEVAAQYPEDYDAQTLYAEALMDTTPWDYWKENEEPKEVTRELLRTLERVLARRPNHPLANHLYIHVVEKVHPDWGVAAAERIGDLVPDAGHLVHMPSHIFIRIGRYQDANRANQEAIAADRSYIAQCHAQGVYSLGYVPHNHHFLWFGKAMTGESRDCLAAARHTREHVDREKMREPGFGALQHYYTLPLWTYVRFGMWDEALAEPEPADDLKYPRGVWHFARGMALARTGKPDRARDELGALTRLATDDRLAEVTIWELNDTQSLLEIAEEVLSATITEARGDLAVAESRLRDAVRLEEALVYDEPPTWFIPPRQLLGAVLLKAGKPAEAERVYREELRIYPDNGWSLFGLRQALEEQGENEKARKVGERFEQAWSQADVTLEESRF